MAFCDEKVFYATMTFPGTVRIWVRMIDFNVSGWHSFLDLVGY